MRVLGVRHPKSELNTISTAAELVEHHPGRARVHGDMPIKPTDRIKRGILLIDRNIIGLYPVLILDLIFGYGNDDARRLNSGRC
jgi:hypothetical protein